MASSDDMITINATVDIPAAALQAVVDNAKKAAGKDEKGAYRVDTHEKLCGMISAFLTENDFLAYVQNPNNY
ncbi:MAG TPA: hypothetical protein VKN73_13745 [Desulfosalsimonadaceae bacterium]|nr:hypothetical protein [Desulfosalsimonadaceae bacterium]